MSASAGVFRQWLLFDSIPESAAVTLFNDLMARVPVLALREQAALRIPHVRLEKCPAEHRGVFNGPMPTLIPSEFTPSPVWGELRASSYLDGKSVLGLKLAACPTIVDERIRTAIELSIASRYDSLPRSIFLSQLTIIDSLAIRVDRPSCTQFWLDEKIKEAESLKDQGLITSLKNLKQGSHGSAVRGLVGRAVEVKDGNDHNVAEYRKRVGELYQVRSGLSHASGKAMTSQDVEDARRLARLVLESAISNPAILDPAC
jgi:hypothetical protein